MASFDRILSQFKNLGYNQESYLTWNQINRALDTISNQNARISQFDRVISQQLFTHSQPDPSRGVRLADFINSVLEGQSILREQINNTEACLRIQTNPNTKASLQDQYNQIIYDHQTIASTFRLPALRQVNSNQVSGILRDRAPMTQINHNQSRHGDSVIFAYQANTRQQSSTDLKICLFIAVFMLVLQVILMFHKHHFLNVLCIFGVLSIFFLNYFDKNYIKFLLILLAASSILDFVWLGVHARQYWSPDPPTQHSTLHTGFLAFIFIMVIVLMGLKIACAAILFKYRTNSQSIKKNISAFGYKIKLDGRPTYNPFSPLLRSAPYASAF